MRIGRGFSVPALTVQHLQQVVCPPRSRLFCGRSSGLLSAGSRTSAIPTAQLLFRFPMQPSALLARASTRMQSVCSFSKAAMRHHISRSCQRKGLGADVQSAARYWLSRGSTTCSISSLLHSPSASRMAFASYRNASMRLWDR